MTLTPLKSALPDKTTMDKFKNVKSRQDLKDVLFLEKLKNNYWTAIPNKVLFNENISDGAKILWEMLQSVGGLGGYSFYGQRKLALISRKSRRTIQRYIKELEKSGLLKIESGGYNRSNNHFIIWPVGCQKPRFKSAITRSKTIGKRY